MMIGKRGPLIFTGRSAFFPSKVPVSVAITAQSSSNLDRGYVVTKVDSQGKFAVYCTSDHLWLAQLGKHRAGRAPVKTLLTLTPFLQSSIAFPPPSLPQLPLLSPSHTSL